MKTYMLNGFGCFILAMGIWLTKSAHIATSGAAGLALTIVHVSGLPFFFMFILVNFPFFLLSYWKLGLQYTLTSTFSVGFLSLFTFLAVTLPEFDIHPFAGAVFGGCLVGVGAVVIFLSRSSMGGATILAVFLQQKYKMDPGKVIFFFDSTVSLITFYFLGMKNGFYTLLSIFVCSAVISYFKKIIREKNAIAERKLEKAG
ncbi:YitT family protein [Anaerobacillus sp. MEB173]|uniref:YitT family protein n=1 Tax=Anaerobacillus sp. MEB173 TaxID=3383345 RepID=UPI003F901782